MSARPHVKRGSHAGNVDIPSRSDVTCVDQQLSAAMNLRAAHRAARSVV
jgi:hypothetical protein